MRRVIATLGVFALVGAFAGEVSARAGTGQTIRGGGVITIGTVTRGPNCDELGQLRQELLRLEQELRELKAAFDEAKANGNRQRALQILKQIHRVESRIEDVQHKIRRLLQVCHGN
jgi:chromosome segregation ATPase